MADPGIDVPYWSRDIAELSAALGSGSQGLSSKAAAARLRLVGRNSVEDACRLSTLRLLLRQFESPLVLILIFGAAVSLTLREWADAGIILTIAHSTSTESFCRVSENRPVVVVRVDVRQCNRVVRAWTLNAVKLDQLTEEQRGLWARVDALWKMSAAQDTSSAADALHPDYVGWVTGQSEPHGRDAAIASVGPSSPRVLSYKLQPLSIAVFDDTTGVVHYTYVAEVECGPNASKTVSGRWSEMYLRKNGQWIMISASGGPDGER